MNATADSADFVADDEFDDAEDFFPYAPVQQWAVLSDRITAEQVAVLAFTMSHLNPSTGRFDAKFGRNRVAERYQKSLDWVDKQFKGLVAAGAMTKQHMYWIDAKSRTARSPEGVDPETGVKRAQASNRWRVRMSPPAASAYPGPVNIGEFYNPGKIATRLSRSDSPATLQRPPSDQRKQRGSAGARGAAAQRPGGAAPERPGGAAVQRPKQTHKGTNTGKKTKDRGAYPPDPPEPAADAAGPNNINKLDQNLASKTTPRRNHLHARARELAGPEAVAAVASNLSITEGELAAIVATSDPNLTQAQCFGRAAALMAWEHKARSPAPRAADRAAGQLRQDKVQAPSVSFAVAGQGAPVSSQR